MGLVDFVRGIGKKVFSHEEEAAEESKTASESANRAVITDATLLVPGQKIRLPPE